MTNFTSKFILDYYFQVNITTAWYHVNKLSTGVLKYFKILIGILELWLLFIE